MRTSITCERASRGSSRDRRGVAKCQSPQGYGLVIAPLVPANCKGVIGVSTMESLVGTRPQGGSAAQAPLAKQNIWLLAFSSSTTKGGDLLSGLIISDSHDGRSFLRFTFVDLFCPTACTIARDGVRAPNPTRFKNTVASNAPSTIESMATNQETIPATTQRPNAKPCFNAEMERHPSKAFN